MCQTTIINLIQGHVLHTQNCRTCFFSLGSAAVLIVNYSHRHRSFARPRSGSLYVSGAPGTGKTATLTHLLATRLAASPHQAVFINCMVLKSSLAIYKEVAAQLSPQSAVKTEKEALKVIEKTITSKGPMILLGKRLWG